jgi:hypothetical protein
MNKCSADRAFLVVAILTLEQDQFLGHESPHGVF